MFKRRFIVCSLAVFALLVPTTSWTLLASSSEPAASTGPDPVSGVLGLVNTLVGGLLGSPTTVVAAPAGPPVTPPAQICGNASILNGPATAPAGAVTVRPGQSLFSVTQASPAGTTFWLAAGVHDLAANGMYGQVQPKDGDTYIGAPGAVFDGKSVNDYAFTGRAVDVTIRYLTIRNFVAPGDEGVVNHDFGTGWVVEHNTVTTNGGAGVMVGTGNRLAYNCLADNSQYGFQVFGANVAIDHNEVARNNTYDYEKKIPGCGCSGGSKFWGAGPARVTANYVHDNNGVGFWADTNTVGVLFDGNYISGNSAHGIVYETSYNARITNNTFLRNAIAEGQTFQSRGDPFPIGAIYISESGGDARVNGGTYADMEISGNSFRDNWAGVVLWENADRYCGSPANSSTGTCTLVNPKANLATCVAGTINAQPYMSDCRWKTQNVTIQNNDFAMDKAAIGCTTGLCGLQGLFSNYGTVPAWSPYKGRVVQDAITFHQNIRFSANRYVGDWRFTAYEAVGKVLTLGQWQAAPYNQDAAATISP
ncbi:MAG: right-handed parallel beta-helix repeat-containing protein [Actinomycetota bacterium]|nr:right-handed parallel beta-helix repeat-containing protein [Actinomycetota bacterium]